MGHCGVGEGIVEHWEMREEHWRSEGVGSRILGEQDIMGHWGEAGGGIMGE